MDKEVLSVRVNGDETIPILMEYVINVILREKNIPYQFDVEPIRIRDQFVNPGAIIMTDYMLNFRKVEPKEQKFKCPIDFEGCTKYCGSYGCGG
jgi:hypothetical protein